MARMLFRYGAMGSSKTALALMTAYNFREKGMEPLLAKPALDTRTDTMWSRVGIEAPCISLEELCDMSHAELSVYDCIIVDEIQFASPGQVELLASVVDDLNIPVFAYGLKTDFRGLLFEGSKRTIELADEIEEVPCACWCGSSAKFSARISPDGKVITEGETIDISSTEPAEEHYVALCRKHYLAGMPYRSSGDGSSH